VWSTAHARRCVTTVENRYLRAETGARTAYGMTTEPSAETRALEHATGDRLIAALRLPRRQRELTLRYYLDLSEAQSPTP
jgi:hypothetical protein